ncbi:MAG: acyl-CoA synthetase (AMP-forming)/AMP-acid ligase II [Myxococcota bacterium]|jgi:acyl-CoA synthetase (AMP-forming)/AMP-acid ligase II
MSAPRVTNIAALMEQRATETPYQRAVVFPEGRDATGNVCWTHLTFQQLNTLTDEYARGFVAAGMRPGDRVSLLVKPCLAFIPLVFAVFKVGALPVLIDPGMGMKSFLACIGRIKPRVLIGEPLAQVLRLVFRKAFGSVEVAITNGKSTMFWGGVTLEGCRVKSDEPFPTVEVKPEDEAAILFTSGSTGPAKGVTYTHGIFSTQTRLIQQTYNIAPGEVDLACFPLFGLFSMAMGMTVVIPDMDPTKPAEADPVKLIEAIEANGCTSAFGSPAIWKNMALHARKHGLKLPRMKRILMAGAPVPVWMHEAFQEIFSDGAQLHTPYGATESLPVASIGSLEILADTGARTRAGAGTCVGRPVADIEVAIIGISDAVIERWSDDLRVAPGEVGELCVKGPQVTPEYKDLPEQTAKAKIYGSNGAFWHRMGDLVYQDDQERLWFCGRKSHRVTLADGTLTFPVPCEGVFNEHPEVYRTAVVGVNGQAILVVELEPTSNTPRDTITSELLKIGACNPKTTHIQRVLYHTGFPVDVRHNAKIRRLELAEWAGSHR